MPSSEVQYFRARAREERDRAMEAPDRTIAAVHVRFAIEYEAAAKRLVEGEQLQSTRDALQRSHQLLHATARQVRETDSLTNPD